MQVLSADLAAGSKLYADKAKDLYRQVLAADVEHAQGLLLLRSHSHPAVLHAGGACAGTLAKVHANSCGVRDHPAGALVPVAVLLVTQQQAQVRSVRENSRERGEV